jgi:peptide/nickel transport system permease protein
VTAYIGRRLLQLIPLFLVVSTLLFVALRLAPGDPVLAIYGAQPGVSREVIAAAQHELGVDQPIVVQYGRWASDVVRGDLGVSSVNRRDVTELLREKLPASLELAFAALLLSVLVSIPLGTLSAVRRGSWLDQAVGGFVAAGIAIPSFWLGILLALLFAVELGWVPSTGYVPFLEDPIANLQYLALPATTLAVALAAPVTRFVRSSMLDVLQEPYIQTGRALGLSENAVIYRHALRNAIPAAITVIGLQLGTLLGGAVMIEWVFGWPGLGQLLISAITARDYAVVQGAILLTIALFVFANVLVDVVHAWLDPRIGHR